MLIVLYTLGSILLVILIILGIKLIVTMNKIENVVEDINVKVDKLNGVFQLIDNTTDKLALFSDKMIDGIIFIFKKLFKSKKRKDSEEETDE